ncbi:outer membrane lipoprotein chaperone LolA [Halomonas sediminis]
MKVTAQKGYKHYATLITAVAGVMMAPMAWADAGQMLTERLDPLETYHADFEQLILDSAGERLQEAQGEMWLARPGLLRWEVEAPYSQVVVSTGDEVYMYDPDLEQVTVQAVDQRVTHTPALLLSGSSSELTENYEVFHNREEGRDVFTLVPMGADTLFEELTMFFDDDILTRLLMTDSTGQRTAITFSDIDYNRYIDPERFIFSVPDGVDVIRDTY